MEKQKAQQVAQAFSMMDTVCSQAVLNRAEHENLKAACTLVAETLSEIIQPEEEQPEA